MWDCIARDSSRFQALKKGSIDNPTGAWCILDMYRSQIHVWIWNAPCSGGIFDGAYFQHLKSWTIATNREGVVPWANLHQIITPSAVRFGWMDTYVMIYYELCWNVTIQDREVESSIWIKQWPSLCTTWVTRVDPFMSLSFLRRRQPVS